jgi:hypothetical protein
MATGKLVIEIVAVALKSTHCLLQHIRMSSEREGTLLPWTNELVTNRMVDHAEHA